MTARRDAGVALVVTLLVTVLLVAMVFEIFRAGSRSAMGAGYGRDAIRAALIAEAGTAAARVALIRDAKDNRIDTLDEIWSRPAPPLELGGGDIVVTVEDEERKVNVNRLVLPNGIAPDDQQVEVFRRLLGIVGADPSIADAVVDWLDVDDSQRVGGAESSYYQSLPYPYRAKNDLFDSFEELRLVRGVTRDVLERLRPFVTVHSGGKININTAPKEVLMALSAGKDASDVGPIDEATANRIIDHRSQNPFASVDQIGTVSPFLDDLYRRTRIRDLVDVRSTVFHARSTGNIAGTVKTADAVGFRTGNDIQWRCWRLE